MRYKNIFLLIILLLGFGVRFFGIDKSPATVNFDEASLGYNAYSIMKTGMDEYGFKFPLSLKSFGDYKPALYAYVSIPFIWIFGLNSMSLRLASMIAGVLLAYFSYLILKFFVKDEKFCLIALLLFLFQPWAIHFSRVALETNLSAMFFTVGIYFYLKNLRIKKTINFVIYLIAFVLSMLSYHSARVAVPLFIILMQFDPINLLFLGKKYSFKIDKNNVIALTIALFVLVLVFMDSNKDSVLARYNIENVFKKYHPYTPSEVLDKPLAFWSNNPIYYLIGMLSGRLMAYFSPINWSGRLFHFNMNSVQYIAGFSMLGWLEMFLLIIGICFIVKYITKDKNRHLIYWIIASLAAAAATWTWFHPLRCLNMMGAIQVILAIGLYNLTKNLNVIGKSFLVLLFLWQGVFIINNELSYSYYENHGNFQPGGFKQAVEIINDVYDKYDEIIIDSPHSQAYSFILYYFQVDPTLLQAKGKDRLKADSRGNWNVDFAKFKFRKIDWYGGDRNLKNVVLWMPPTVPAKDIEDWPNAKLYQLDTAINLYKSAFIVTLD